MKMRMIVAVALATAPSAQAVCREPSAPRAPSAYDMPEKPRCMTDANFNAEPCSDYERNRYYDAARRYEIDISTYLNRLQDHYEAGLRYGECLRNEMAGRRY